MEDQILIIFIGDGNQMNAIFQVQGIEKSNNRPNNELYLDHVDEKWAKDMDQMDMIVFSIGHWFLLQAIYHEGAWDKAGACPKTKPYRSEEKKVEGMDNEMRKVEVEEVENAKNKGNEFGRFRFEVLDITNLALLRPDGHP
ncbi:hypothetical protein L195_g042589, partial [Trifolium pratense]